MSIISLEQRLTQDGWVVPTRREIGYGLQFFAFGLFIGNFLGVGYGHIRDEVFWIQLMFTGLLLLGSWLIRFKAGKVIWIQLALIGLTLLIMWMLVRHIRGH
jgi:hypothetical protein